MADKTYIDKSGHFSKAGGSGITIEEVNNRPIKELVVWTCDTGGIGSYTKEQIEQQTGLVFD